MWADQRLSRARLLTTHYSVSEAGARLVQTVRVHRDWVARVGQVIS